MIDPRFITKYDRTDKELEEFAIFSICAAGKNAKHIARAVHTLCDNVCALDFLSNHPLHCIYYYVRRYGIDGLCSLLKFHRIGCYRSKSNTIYEVAERLIIQRPDFLSACTVEDLESIKGIGPKTARFFILHSRPNMRLAALDTHILHWLRDHGIDAPKTTPTKGSVKYKELELTFLELCDKLVRSPAELDLIIWNTYSKNGLYHE